MIAILGYDGLEYDFVTQNNYTKLLQTSYGRTDLGGFELPQTPIIWASFMAGKNMKDAFQDKDSLWTFRLKDEDTFLSNFANPISFDVPGYNFIKERHEEERADLKAFFEDKSITIEEYDKKGFAHHELIKGKFLSALESGEHDIVMGYFGIADVLGHLSFGMKIKMKLIYDDLGKLVEEVQTRYNCPILVISDHGMESVGRFGDHSDHGFWSVNFDLELDNPKPTDFAEIIATTMKDMDK
jgi:fructose/tagatose bisphosphate aldolase